MADAFLFLSLVGTVNGEKKNQNIVQQYCDSYDQFQQSGEESGRFWIISS